MYVTRPLRSKRSKPFILEINIMSNQSTGSTNFSQGSVSIFHNESMHPFSEVGDISNNGNESMRPFSEVGDISNSDNESMSYYYSYDYTYEYDDYMYPGYSFERPVYLYVWEPLVVITFLLNVVVLFVFFRRKMLSPTILILSAIAISDSLTGLVTLPTYILVYQRYEPPISDSAIDDLVSMNQSQTMPLVNNRSVQKLIHGDNVTKVKSFNINDTRIFMNTFDSYNNFHLNNTEVKRASNGTHATMTSSVNVHHFYYTATMAPIHGYTLTKNLCRGFMITKYFLSTSFHTISIFLTLFLGIQRYMSMAYPFKAETFFSFKKTLAYSLVIFILSPGLHVYHLITEKAQHGMCQWKIKETGCKEGCIYLWAAFVIRHFIPCSALLYFTILFIQQLSKGEKQFKSVASTRSQVSLRLIENRRVSFIVTVVVIVRLIPEVPYSVFLLYNGVDRAINSGMNIDLQTNRAIHMTYEIVLMLSYQANFFIYVLFNHKFRSCLLGACAALRWRLTGRSKGVHGCAIVQRSLTGETHFRTRDSNNVGDEIERTVDHAGAYRHESPTAQDILLLTSNRSEEDTGHISRQKKDIEY